MVRKARLSWRSPERSSRCRVTCPDDAGIGLAPAKAAKAASERSRPAWDQLISTWLQPYPTRRIAERCVVIDEKLVSGNRTLSSSPM